MTAFRVLADTLAELADAIAGLTLNEFSARPFRSSGSVGGHVRHCLDHVAALEGGMVSGEVCYDHRERNTAVERDPRLAVSRLRRAAARLRGYAGQLGDRPLTLVAQVDAGGTAVRVPTTVGREAAFVISHTIHHAALVAVLLEQADRVVPSRLGLAPTTPELVCVR